MKFLGLLKYHFLCLLREPLNLFFGIAFPILTMVLMPGSEEGATSMMFFALPVIAVVAIMTLSFMDSAFSHAYSRQVKFLRRIRMTPVSSSTYIASGILSRFLAVLAFVALSTAVVGAMADVSFADINWFLYLGVLTLVYIMFYLIAMVVANLSKNAKKAQALLYVAFFGLLVLGGFMLPLQALPEVVQDILRFLPPAFASNLLSDAWLGNSIFEGWSFFATVGSIVVFGLLSIKLFKYE